MNSYQFYGTKGSIATVIVADGTDLKWLINILAKNVIERCKVRPVITMGGIPSLANEVQAQVLFVHTWTKAILDKTISTWDARETLILIKEMLIKYQAWKTDICKQEQALMGEHWGTATGFYKMDWTEIIPQIDEALK